MIGKYSLSIHCKSSSIYRRVTRIFGVALLGLGLVGYGVAATAKPGPDVNAVESPQGLKSALPNQPGFAFGILGSLELKTAKHRFQKDWRDMLVRYEGERALYERCSEGGENCPPKLRQWRRLINELRGLPKSEQLTKLTRSLNRMVPYTEDSAAFGKKDYWATPVEFFRNGGDCEDYAIVKFLSLLELGFDNDQLRVAIVKDKRRRLMHAVTTVRIDDRVHILDNLNDHPVQHQYVLKYVPIYSANLDAQWAHIVTNKMRAAFVTQVMNKNAQARRGKKPAGKKAARVSNLQGSRGAQIPN